MKSFFEFTSYRFDSIKRKAFFSYRLGSPTGDIYEFTEILTFSDLSKFPVNPELLDRVMQAVHMALGISYYKLYCPSEIQVKTKSLSNSQAKFWNSIYTNGLMQLFYENKIDFRNLIDFPFDEHVRSTPIDSTFSDRALIALGGGKDSLVSYELVRDIGMDIDFFALNKFNLHESIAQKLNENHLVVERQIDSQVFELDKKNDSFNGHVPITMINSFASLLAAVLFDYKYIIFSNEQSADFGNINYLGNQVNHQWSKSIEFERLLSEYIDKNLSASLKCFSLLRPFYEIEIVKRFSRMSQYFYMISSCNRNFALIQQSKNTKLWCCECEKCAFVFALLSAFVTKKELISIFGENLYEKESLLQTYKDLLGVGVMKPFECVGTPEETTVAMYMASQKGEYKGSVIMNMFENDVLPTVKSIDDLKNQVFKYGDDSLIPEKFRKIL